MGWFYLIGIGSIDNRWQVWWVMRKMCNEGVSAGYELMVMVGHVVSMVE